jgi:hypothetical protein
LRITLKVPKCEIFNRSDFHGFYTIKSLWEGGFGVKIKKILQNILGFNWGHEIPYTYAQSHFKEDFSLGKKNVWESFDTIWYCQ